MGGAVQTAAPPATKGDGLKKVRIKHSQGKVVDTDGNWVRTDVKVFGSYTTSAPEHKRINFESGDVIEVCDEHYGAGVLEGTWEPVPDATPLSGQREMTPEEQALIKRAEEEAMAKAERDALKAKMDEEIKARSAKK